MVSLSLKSFNGSTPQNEVKCTAWQTSPCMSGWLCLQPYIPSISVSSFASSIWNAQHFSEHLPCARCLQALHMLVVVPSLWQPCETDTTTSPFLGRGHWFTGVGICPRSCLFQSLEVTPRQPSSRWKCWGLGDSQQTISGFHELTYSSFCLMYHYLLSSPG